LYEGGVPVFADVEPDTLLIDPVSVGVKITPKTKAIVAVDYAGQPADYDALRELVRGRGIAIIADACHAPGASYKGRSTGTLGDISCFSFHPVKHLTTCEGGMAVTQDAGMAAHMRRFRNHGIDSDHRSREASGAHVYDMAELGFNYRLPDVQCALGMAQLARLSGWVAARQRIAALVGGGIPGARWVPPENYHMTLRFIGEAPAHRAEEIDIALASLRARGFSLTLAGLGTFAKGGRSTALWVGVERNPQLDHLQNKIETALQRIGLEPERRRFQPHVTLARLDNVAEGKLVSFVQAHNLFRAEPVPVEHFTLFSSQLGKEASVYTAEVEYALA
jgi:2'-5' RNA ligase